MGQRIRIFEPGFVYSVVIRCVDRQFLLKPDHDPRSPLLAAGCPPEALDRTSPIVPVPSVINVIGASAARALELEPVRLHWLDANINHLEVGFSAGDEEQLANIPDFFRNMLSAIAVKLNAKWHRDGHLWAGSYRDGECVDDAAGEAQLFYNVTNPVKDGLVETVRSSPFFNSFRALAQGKTQRYFRIDWHAFQLAGGNRKKGHSPKQYMKWLELPFSPLPHQADWPDHKRQAWVRAHVRDVEKATKEKLAAEGRAAMGVRAQFEVDPRDRPRNPKSSGPRPLCHWTEEPARDAYRERRRDTERAHRAASIDYRLGDHEREFPDGTFRPPLIQICRADE